MTNLIQKAKSIFHALNTKGSVFPHELAFTLLLPVRNLTLSPKLLVSRLALHPAYRVLEVGCGPAYFSPALAKSVPQGRLVLCDIQPQMLAYAKKRLKKQQISNVDYYLCDGDTFEFTDESFERIVLVAVLGEVANQGAYLREFYRLLTPNGRVSISEGMGDADKFSKDELTKLMNEYGFTLEEQFGNDKTYTMNFKKDRLSKYHA